MVFYFFFFYKFLHRGNGAQPYQTPFYILKEPHFPSKDYRHAIMINIQTLPNIIGTDDITYLFFLNMSTLTI